MQRDTNKEPFKHLYSSVQNSGLCKQLFLDSSLLFLFSHVFGATVACCAKGRVAQNSRRTVSGSTSNANFINITAATHTFDPRFGEASRRQQVCADHSSLATVIQSEVVCSSPLLEHHIIKSLLLLLRLWHIAACRTMASSPRPPAAGRPYGRSRCGAQAPV
jgi:hypothetical protein